MVQSHKKVHMYNNITPSSKKNQKNLYHCFVRNPSKTDNRHNWPWLANNNCPARKLKGNSRMTKKHSLANVHLKVVLK